MDLAPERVRADVNYIRNARDIKLLESCFDENASMQLQADQPPIQGRDNIVAFFTLIFHPTMVTSHMVTQPEITIGSADAATGLWHVEDTAHFTGANPNLGGAGFKGGDERRGAGIYYDRYVRNADGWRTAASDLVRFMEHLTHSGNDADKELTVDPRRGVRRQAA